MEANNFFNHTNEERVSIAVEKPLRRIQGHVTRTDEQRERSRQYQRERRARMTAGQWANQRERQQQRDRERRQLKKIQACRALKEQTIGSNAEPHMEGQDGSEIERKSRYMSGTWTNEQREAETREQGEQSMKSQNSSVMKDGKQVPEENIRALVCDRTEQRHRDSSEREAQDMSGTSSDEQRDSEIRKQGERSTKSQNNSVMKDGKQISQGNLRALDYERTEQDHQHRNERKALVMSGTSSTEQGERETREEQQGEQRMKNQNGYVMKDGKQDSQEILRALTCDRTEQGTHQQKERRRQCQKERRGSMTDEEVARLRERRRQLDRERRKRKKMETSNALKEQTVGANSKQHKEGQDASEIEQKSRNMSGTLTDEERKRERREHQQGEQSLKSQNSSIMKGEKQISQEILRALANERREKRHQHQREQRAHMTVEQSAEQSQRRPEYAGENPSQMTYGELLSQREQNCQYKREHRSTMTEEQLLKMKEQRREKDRIRRANMTQEQLLHLRERRRRCQKVRRDKIRKLAALRDANNNQVDLPEKNVDHDRVQIGEFAQRSCESERDMNNNQVGSPEGHLGQDQMQKLELTEQICKPKREEQCNEVQQHQLQMQKIGQGSQGAEGIADSNINLQCQNAEFKHNDAHMEDRKTTDSMTGEDFAMMSSGTTICSGGCHCKHVRWQVEASPNVVAWSCNCSDCSVRGNTHFIVPSAKFKLREESEQYLTAYTFGIHTAKHIFCKVCGITSFYIPKSNPDGIAVTVNCVDAGLLKHVEIRHFDGKHWENSLAQTSISSFSKSEVKCL